MIRLIFKAERLYETTQLRTLDYFTIDVALPEIEAILKHGGRSESGYDIITLIGCELDPTESKKESELQIPVSNEKMGVL